MSDVVKKKIIDIETGQSVKNVEKLTDSFVPLRKQIRDLQNQLAQLEKGTEEYDRVAKQLADTRQKQIQINEAAKYSNKDFGATMSNLTTVSMGLVGGINAISASMALLSNDSEKMQKALVPIQMVMAAIQGFSALDKAIKALNGLKVAFLGVGTGASEAVSDINDLGKSLDGLGSKKVDVVVDGSEAVKEVKTIETSLDGLGSKKVDVVVDGSEAVKEVKTIETSIDTISDKKVELDVKSDTAGVEEVKSELSSIPTEKEVVVDVVGDSTEAELIKSEIETIPTEKDVKIDVKSDTGEVELIKSELSSIPTEKDVKIDVKSDTGEVELIKSEIETIPTEKEVVVDVKSDTTGVKEVKSELSSIPSDKKVELDVKSDTAGVKEVKSELSSIPSEKEVKIDVKSDTGEVELTKAEIETIPSEKEVKIDVKSDAVEEVATTKAALDTLPEKVTVDIDSEGVDSMAEGVEKLNKAESNLATTGVSVAKTNKTITTTGKAATVGLSGLTKGIRAAAAALKSFIVSNPILMGIAAAIAAVAGAVALLNKRFEENGRIAKEEADILTQANAQFEDQSVRLNVLLKTAKDHNQSLEERKKATEELNKIVPEYNAQINETTGALEANNEALTTYINNLKEKLTLEAYESKIKEYLQKQVELEEEINDIENTGWWFVKKRIKDRRKEIAELGTDIDRLYGKIANLDLSKALASNKVETQSKKLGSTIKKTIGDAINELRKLTDDFWDSFFNARELQRKMNGVTSEFDSMFFKLKDSVDKAVKKYKFGEKLTDEFKDFIKKGLKVENLDFNFGTFKMEDVFKIDVSGLVKGLKDGVDELEVEIESLTNKTGSMTNAQKKLIDSKTKQLAQMKRELEAYNLLIDAVEEYKKSTLELSETKFNATIESNKQISLENKLLKIQEEYRKQLFGNNYLADTNKTIASEEAEYEILQKVNNKLKERVTILESDEKYAEAHKDEIKRLNKQIEDNERELANKSIQIDIDKWNRRKEESKHYYEELDKEVTQQQRKLENENITRGFGTPSYSTQYQQQKLLVDRLNSEMETLKQQHDLQLIEEEEFNAKMLELKTHLTEESAKLDDYRIDRAVSAVNTYMNVFSSVTSSISSILQEQMNKYDENSEEYKQLQVTNSWITTLSGTLGAFMSGFQSGIPWPYNLIVAAAMGATTFAAGAAQIANLQNGTHTNALTSSAKSSGQSTYETEVFSQQTDLLGKIKDTKVVVLESDISNTQRRVNVRETNSTF